MDTLDLLASQVITCTTDMMAPRYRLNEKLIVMRGVRRGAAYVLVISSDNEQWIGSDSDARNKSGKKFEILGVC
ncbi:MAG: hypothetical protein Unbinned664contig1000_9 [Prokaryotic dsDNA virus sp.]|nr:MAG: hypothetical protein Unbinned664contig1000_9 [Prokaryotic dsDNA virus sp.]|tara:strand:+ start:27401 stop:27622 length:222 start_codon:yes stop_codon:yes gene_type:complete